MWAASQCLLQAGSASSYGSRPRCNQQLPSTHSHIQSTHTDSMVLGERRIHAEIWPGTCSVTSLTQPPTVFRRLSCFGLCCSAAFSMPVYSATCKMRNFEAAQQQLRQLVRALQPHNSSRSVTGINQHPALPAAWASAAAGVCAGFTSSSSSGNTGGSWQGVYLGCGRHVSPPHGGNRQHTDTSFPSQKVCCGLYIFSTSGAFTQQGCSRQRTGVHCQRALDCTVMHTNSCIS